MVDGRSVDDVAEPAVAQPRNGKESFCYHCANVWMLYIGTLYHRPRGTYHQSWTCHIDELLTIFPLEPPLGSYSARHNVDFHLFCCAELLCYS
jgi:hypothetical protein